jgi:choline kinase/mannose-6-phosphate isomerase-like protein (cupin superfamily)
MSNIDSAYTVYKPWGKEVWIELNDKYCYKRIYINAGTKTSYQYHNNKLETNFIIEGIAEIWLENEYGAVEKKIMKAGEFFTVIPPRKHRVVAITDIILQEVSTPEVNDVVRISDDTNRKDGKLNYEHLRPALCILTAGIGSRLEHLSEHINKCLLPLNNKAIISHIIEKTPKEYEIIVALGYRGEMVKEYCESAHPDRDFKFVVVDNYIGEKSGPAYSINQCKKYLQRPFIWTVGDLVIADDLPRLDNNWLGICPTSIPQLYSTVNLDTNIDSSNVIGFKNKDKNGYDYAFIGLSGVYDFETFWKQLDVESGEIVSAYYNINEYLNIKGKNLEWYDIGTIDNYLKSKKIFEKESHQYSIPKTNGEFLYKVEDRFIKLSSDCNFIEGRIKRTNELNLFKPN